MPTSVDGAWEHWPSAVRARAFGVMLLMPDEGVRSVLRGRRPPDAADVRRVMELFGTGPHATAWHFLNRQYIDEDQRLAILQQLAA